MRSKALLSVDFSQIKARQEGGAVALAFSLTPLVLYSYSSALEREKGILRKALMAACPPTFIVHKEGMRQPIIFESKNYLIQELHASIQHSPWLPFWGKTQYILSYTKIKVNLKRCWSSFLFPHTLCMVLWGPCWWIRAICQDKCFFREHKQHSLSTDTF